MQAPPTERTAPVDMYDSCRVHLGPPQSCGVAFSAASIFADFSERQFLPAPRFVGRHLGSLISLAWLSFGMYVRIGLCP
jgi:hypothetical protein